MKRKDIITLAIAVVILAAAGYIAFTQLLPTKSGSSQSGTVVETVGVITSNLNQDALSTLEDPTQTQDFMPGIDLTQGLNNTAPFGQ